MNTQQDIAKHFDSEAARYDYWKQKNWYYYDTLKVIARRWARQDKLLLDAGCGTGGVIMAVGPARAVGIDISPEMIAIAKRKYAAHPEYTFIASDIAHFTSTEQFDTILFFDVIEHLIDPKSALESIVKLLAPNGKCVATMANPLWEPILMAGEKLGMKMPEGPHYRMPTKKFLDMCDQAGLKLLKRDWRLIFPKYIPIFSSLLNDCISRIPGIRNLSMIEIFILQKK